MTIYYHKHHIIPKHMGGTCASENLVKVTVEQHAALHKQLWEDLGHWQDELAWKALSGQISNQEAIRQSISLTQKGRKKPASVVQAIIESNKRRTGEKHHFFGKKRPPETIEKMRVSHLGQVPWNKGMVCTPEEVEKNRNAQINLPEVPCPHCGRMIKNVGNMSQHIRAAHKNKYFQTYRV